LELLEKLQQDKGLSYLFISHDLAVVAELADEIAVMYQGKIIEQGAAMQVIQQPKHAYTKNCWRLCRFLIPHWFETFVEISPYSRHVNGV